MAGRTRFIFITYTVDAVDWFYQGGGERRVRCDHPNIDEQEISVGQGRLGRTRAAIAAADTVALCDDIPEIILRNWSRAGRIGHRLVCTMTLSILKEIRGAGTGGGKPTKTGQDTGCRTTVL